jgi:hypothetical protein
MSAEKIHLAQSEDAIPAATPRTRSLLLQAISPGESSLRIFHLILGLCLLALTVGFALHAIDLLYDGRFSVTRQDYWRIYKLDLSLPFPLNALYRHNDHPLFFPSLIWLPILYFFHNDQTLLFFCGLAITLTTLILMLVSVWRSPTLGHLPRLAIGLIYTVACLWLGKANITTSGGYSCINSLTMSAVVGGLLVLDRLQAARSDAARWRLFAWLLAAGIVASFSFGTGLAIWPTFIVLAVLYRLGGKIASGLGAAGLLSAAIFVFLPNNGESGIGDGLSHLKSEWPTLIGQFFQVLGAPWVDYGTGWLGNRLLLAAGGIGVLGILLGLYLIAARYRSLRTSEPAETVAFGMMLFILGSIALIVIGRAGLLAINPGGVLAPRYCFWSPFFWAALPVMGLYSWPRLRLYPTALCFFALGLTAATLPSHLHGGATYAWMRKTTEDAALRVICGVEDEPSLQRLFKSGSPSENLILPLARIYRERGLDMFAWPGARLVGQPLPPVTPFQSEESGLSGHWQVDQIVQTLRKDQPGARFSGWCLTRKTHRTAEYVLISETSGQVVGLGRFTVDKPKWNQKYGLSARHVLGFQGYIQNYSRNGRYLCRAAVDDKLVPQPLRRIGPDS